MFSRKELKENLLGCLEVALFMRSGVGRFSDSKQAALRSFVVPALFIPMVVWVWILRSDAEPVAAVVAIHFFRLILSMGVFMGIVYLFSRQYERQEHFFRFITVSNWFGLIGTMLTVPVLIALLGGADMALWENYAVFVQLFGYVYTGFIVTQVFRVPWEMGGFVAVVALAVGQNLLDLGLYVQNMLTVAV